MNEKCECGHDLKSHGTYGNCWHWTDLSKGITCECKSGPMFNDGRLWR